MKEEWNAGYEKGYADAKECCNQDCNQGRNCPLRKKQEFEIARLELALKNALLFIRGGRHK